MATAGKEECGECKAVVAGKDKGVYCEICESWYHAKCQGISEDTYKYLQKGQGVHWYCKGCDKGVVKLLTAISSLQKQQDKLETDMKELAKEVTEIKREIHDKNKKIHEKMDSELKGVTAKMRNFEDRFEEKVRRIVKEEMVRSQEEVKEKVDESLKLLLEAKKDDTQWSDIVAKQVDDRFMVLSSDLYEAKQRADETNERIAEDVEKIKRKNNVVIFNVKESDAESYKEKLQEDKDFCIEMMNQVLKVGYEEGNIKKIHRLGKWQEGCKRPLMVEFEDGRTKNLVMEFAGRLANAPERFKGVVITHDMTQKERLQCKNLVEEAKKQQMEDQSGEWQYKVRGQPGQMKIVRMRKRY